jgi:hypothetical protein
MTQAKQFTVEEANATKSLTAVPPSLNFSKNWQKKRPLGSA